MSQGPNAERIIALQRRTEQFAARLRSSLGSIRDATGASEDGGVRVTVRPDGSVVGVELRAGWRREADDSDLGALVLRAMSAALNEQVRQWSDGLAAPGATTVAAPAVATPPEPDVAVAPPEGPAGDHYLQSLVDSVGGTEGATDELIESLRAAASARFTGGDDSGQVTATADGRGQLVALGADPSWIEKTGDATVARALTTAITRAVENAKQNNDLDRVVGQSRLGRLQRALAGTPPTTR